MPPFKKTNFQPGQTESKHTGKMLTIKWMDRREMHMLTTIHEDEQLPIQKHGKITMKPKCVKKYNENMGFVDKTDMILSSVVFTGNHMPIAQFQIELIRQIIEKYHTDRVTKSRQPIKDQPSKLIDRHFPSEVPATQSGRLARRRCQLCKKNNKRTDTRCVCTEFKSADNGAEYVDDSAAAAARTLEQKVRRFREELCLVKILDIVNLY
ncbi:piggyBac transposable element-derived protein 4-like [Melanaphis sacchari]|uniref:piggyBac transposable element-derived protein 4-like n=1 Tax=Melanaphis sacchari TaxID=742174 RepID=UPI000DC13BA9|nr:piggyBac transposable element-derived protein 4-like [Melanaphis sacchari]